VDESGFTQRFNTMLPNVAVEILSEGKGNGFICRAMETLHKTKKRRKKPDCASSSILTRHSGFYTHLNIIARNRVMAAGTTEPSQPVHSPGTLIAPGTLLAQPL